MTCRCRLGVDATIRRSCSTGAGEPELLAEAIGGAVVSRCPWGGADVSVVA
jgi:hypothetical protein